MVAKAEEIHAPALCGQPGAKGIQKKLETRRVGLAPGLETYNQTLPFQSTLETRPFVTQGGDLGMQSPSPVSDVGLSRSGTPATKLLT